MKRKNRARLNVAVASFLAILVIGSAFAFVMSDPLRFNGTVNIDAEMMVGIQERVATSGGPGYTYDLHFEDFVRHQDGAYWHKTVSFDIDIYNIVNNGQIAFTIRNLGTVAVEVSVDTYPWDVDTNLPPALVPFITNFTHNFADDITVVLQPGETHIVLFEFDVDFPTIPDHYINEYATFVLVLNYERY